MEKGTQRKQTMQGAEGRTKAAEDSAFQHQGENNLQPRIHTIHSSLRLIKFSNKKFKNYLPFALSQKATNINNQERGVFSFVREFEDEFMKVHRKLSK